MEGARVAAVGLLLLCVAALMILTLQSSSYPLIRFPMTNYLFLILTFIPHDEGVKWASVNRLPRPTSPRISRRSGICRSQPRSSRRRWIARLNDLWVIISLIRPRVGVIPCVSSLIESKRRSKLNLGKGSTIELANHGSLAVG